MTEPESATLRASWPRRIFAALFYTGLCGVLWPVRKRLKGPLLEWHLRQSMAVQAILFCLIAIVIVFAVAVSYTLVFFRQWHESHTPEFYAIFILRKLFICWLVFWIYAAAHTLFSSTYPVPILHRIAKRDRILTATSLITFILIGLIGTGWGVSRYGASLMRSDDTPGSAYILYDDMGQYPRWLFELGFYPLAKAATEQYGEDSVVLLKLSKPHIRTALRHGEFIFIGSHGVANRLLVPGGVFKAEDVNPSRNNPDLQYIYMTGCDQKSTWEAAFAPAEVESFDRLTAVLEHIWWMWITGPEKVRSLE